MDKSRKSEKSSSDKDPSKSKDNLQKKESWNPSELSRDDSLMDKDKSRQILSALDIDQQLKDLDIVNQSIDNALQNVKGNHEQNEQARVVSSNLIQTQSSALDSDQINAEIELLKRNINLKNQIAEKDVVSRQKSEERLVKQFEQEGSFQPSSKQSITDSNKQSGIIENQKLLRPDQIGGSFRADSKADSFQSVYDKSMEDKEIIQIVYEPAEIPAEMIQQFSIRKERPAGKVKVDDSGYYLARRLESDSEETPQSEKEEADQDFSKQQQSHKSINNKSKTSDAYAKVTDESMSKKNKNVSFENTDGLEKERFVPQSKIGQNQSLGLGVTSFNEGKDEQEVMSESEDESDSLHDSKHDGDNCISKRIGKGFTGVFQQPKENDQEVMSESEDESDSLKDSKNDGDISISKRLGKGFAGAFQQPSEKGADMEQVARGSWYKLTKEVSKTKETPSQQDSGSLMEKMARGSWYKLAPQLQKNMSLPGRRLTIMQQKVITEDIDGEKDESAAEYDPSNLQRVETQEENAPNEFIDENFMADKAKRKWFVNFEDSKDADKSKAEHKKDAFIDEAVYDPNDPFSSFLFRSFKKDRQIKQDYTLINIKDPDNLMNVTASTIFPDSVLSRDGVELIQVDESQLIDHENELLIKKKTQEKEMNEYLKAEGNFIETQQTQTEKNLGKRKHELMKIIKDKQERSKMEYNMKKEVLTNSFKLSVDSLIGRIKRQKEKITSSYGPIILNSKKIEKPIFDINKELDPIGHQRLHKLNSLQDQLPQAIIVKVKTVRCMKDKVSSGHFLILVHALDRIGGNRIILDHKNTDKKFKETSKMLREFAIKKKKFLNSDNRQIIKKRADGQTTFVKAAQTGIGFFKADVETSIEDLRETDKIEQIKQDLENSGMTQDEIEDAQYERPIDKNKDILIDLERTHCQYIRFNGRPQDDNIDFNDHVCVMLPPKLETTNCLQFQLVLLKSESIPKDYVVGWGIFPLNNSDFALNEGKFKVPFLFGGVNPTIDKFKKIEQEMMKDIDKWLCNFYFEIQKINLMDIKIEPETGDMYYQPVAGQTAQEQQQMLKMHQNDMIDAQEEAKTQAIQFIPQVPVAALQTEKQPSIIDKKSVKTGGPKSMKSQKSDWDASEDDDSSSVDSDDLNQAEKDERAAEAVAEAFNAPNTSTERTEIDYQLYQFSVAQKYDLTTRRLTYKKIKYITDEIFLELQFRMWRTLQWQTSMFFIFFIYFLRMFIHYTGQYIVLRIMKVPIELFTPRWFRIDLRYAPYKWYHEPVAVVVGAISNSIVFSFLYFLSWVTKRSCKCFPKIFYRIVCWIGIFAVLDPWIVLVLDLVSLNWKYGDMFKLYNWFTTSKDYQSKDSKLIGIYIVILSHFIILVFTSAIFYRYMLHRFMDGRILDLYRRLAGTYKTFFMPSDNEVSVKYLQWVINRFKSKDCIFLSEQSKLLNKYGQQKNVEYVMIYKIEKDLIKRNRMFFKDHDGSLIEVPQNKILASDKDVKKIKKRVKEQKATLYGKNQNDAEYLEKIIHLTLMKIQKDVLGSDFDDEEENPDREEIIPVGTIESKKNSPRHSIHDEASPYMDFNQMNTDQQEVNDRDESYNIELVANTRKSGQESNPRRLGLSGLLSPPSKNSNLL